MNARARTASRLVRRPRGSVLVFAIVFLVILAGLGTAFVMFVIQQSRASANTLHGTEADEIADAALAHVRQVLHQAIGQYRCFSPDAAFDPNRPYNTAYEKPYYRNLHAKAATYFVGGDLTPQPAIGSGGDDDWTPGEFYMTPGPNNYIETMPAAGAGVDDAFLNLGNVYRAFEAKDDEIAVDPSLINQGDYALLYYNEDPLLFYDPSKYTNPLHFTEAPLTTQCQLNGIPVQYFKDSSATEEAPFHYGLARRWQVHSSQAGVYNAGAAHDLPRVANTRGEYYVWIDNLDGKLFAVPQDWGVDVPSTYSKSNDQVLAQVIENLSLALGATEKSNLLSPTLKGVNFVDMGDWVVRIAKSGESLDRASTIDPRAYLFARHTLDHQFNFKRDEYLKTSSTALNINTAPLDVLSAALSEIPLDGDSVSTAKAEALARRICAKRPFLCRVDFEDFLAAHLTQDTSVSLADSANAASPAGLVYRAIPKRDYSTVSLADLAEAPGVMPDNPVYRVLTDKGYVQNRLEWFRKNDTLAPIAGALIDAKAFNNLLNSLSGKVRGGTEFGYSFYSYDGVDQPFDISGTKPKFEYKELTQGDLGTVNQYTIERNPGVPDEVGELIAWRPTNSKGYYSMVFAASDDTQEFARNEVVPGPPAPQTVIDGHGALETPLLGDDTENSGVIEPGGDGIANSYVHGPIRAYRHPKDDPATAPTAAVDSGTAGDGDVAWSPRADFRGRYFKIYILARGIVNISYDPGKGKNITHYGATRRIEALYDALDDELLWRRNVATELRSLGDPSP